LELIKLERLKVPSVRAKIPARELCLLFPAMPDNTSASITDTTESPNPELIDIEVTQEIVKIVAPQCTENKEKALPTSPPLSSAPSTAMESSPFKPSPQQASSAPVSVDQVPSQPKATTLSTVKVVEPKVRDICWNHNRKIFEAKCPTGMVKYYNVLMTHQ